MDSVAHFVLIHDDSMGEHVGELFDKEFNLRDGFFIAFNLDAIAPGAEVHAVGVLDEPEVLVQISVEAGQRVLIFYDQACRGGFHCVDTATCP